MINLTKCQKKLLIVPVNIIRYQEKISYTVTRIGGLSSMLRMLHAVGKAFLCRTLHFTVDPGKLSIPLGIFVLNIAKALQVSDSSCSTPSTGYAFSQWEMMLQCGVVSHWLSPWPEWSLVNPSIPIAPNVRFNRALLTWPIPLPRQ